jgi:hypothetical protein
MDLRPVGYPGRQRQSLLRLVLEKSASGDEFRMMLLYLFLVCLAVWGFVVGISDRKLGDS